MNRVEIYLITWKASELLKVNCFRNEQYTALDIHRYLLIRNIFLIALEMRFFFNVGTFDNFSYRRNSVFLKSCEMNFSLDSARNNMTARVWTQYRFFYYKSYFAFNSGILLIFHCLRQHLSFFQILQSVNVHINNKNKEQKTLGRGCLIKDTRKQIS